LINEDGPGCENVAIDDWLRVHEALADTVGEGDGAPAGVEVIKNLLASPG
jgi:hypothetical protein